MKLTSRVLSGAVLTGAGLLVLSGCGGGGAEGPVDSGELDLTALELTADQEDQMRELYDAALESGKTEVTIYAGHHDEAQPIYDAFEETFPGITIETGSYLGAELQAVLESERETGQHVVSVISNPNADRYAEQGFFEPYAPFTYQADPALEGRIDPAQLAAPDDTYYSPWLLVFGASYNTDLVEADELPDSWAGYGDPEWKGKVTFMTPVPPGGIQTVFTQLYLNEALDDATLEKIAANAQIVAQDQLSLAAISSGEFAVQPFAAAASIVKAQVRDGAPVDIAFPADSVVATEKWGLAAEAPAPEAGELLLNYLHTHDAQEAALAAGSFPSNQLESLESPYGFPALRDLEFVPLKAQEEIRPLTPELVPGWEQIFRE